MGREKYCVRLWNRLEGVAVALSFPRGVGAWSLAGRQEARAGAHPPIAQSLPKTNQRSDVV